MKGYLADFRMVLGDGSRALPALIAMMLALAALDLAGLGLIAPLIVSVASADADSRSVLPAALAGLMNLDLKLIALLVLTVFTIKMFAGYRIQKTLVRFSEMQRGRLMMRLMTAYLEKPYEFFLRRNSADIVNSIVYTTWAFSNGALSPLLRLLTDLTMFVAIVGFLLSMNWLIVALLGVLLLVVVTLYMRMVRQKLAQAGEAVTDSSARTVQGVNQAVGALREIRILGVEQYCLDQLQASTTRFAEGNALYGALSAVPRYLMEWTLVVGLIGVAVLISAMNLAPSVFMPVMGLVAVAAIRLMPGVTSIIASINALRMNRYGLRQMAEDLRGISTTIETRPRSVELPPPERHPFHSLRLEAVTYQYAGAPRPAISEVSLEILAGQAVGFIGRSGSGKSTTADVLLGLLKPQGGTVLINGVDIRRDPRDWMRRVAYIPQQIYLSDDSLLKNVAFGVEAGAIDTARVRRAIATARLEDVVAQLPKGLDTVIGERGVRLSGGQRQRVALARAFYHDRDVIVMDEATASLDHETEQEVVAAIRDLHGKKTLIIIAHRVSTLEGCDVVIRFDQGRVVDHGSYQVIVGGKAYPAKSESAP